MPSLKDSERLAAERAKRRLSDFIRQGWDTVEPISPFINGWHIGAICEHLEALTSGQIDKLIINVPPGHMKSLTCSVFWLPWWWAREPHIRALHAAYAGELSHRDSRRTLSLLQSDWYQARYGDGYIITKANEHRIENTKGGLRIASSTGGVGTGERAHVVVNDDLIRAQDAHSEAMQKQAIAHLKAMDSRAVPGYSFRRLLIMQRLHENDPTGYLLSQELGYEHLRLPAEFEPEKRCVTSIGFSDPRTVEGELLWPEAFGPDAISGAKLIQGTYGYAGQYQQNPAPADGGILKRQWWKYYKVAPEIQRIVQCWDTAFKAGQENDNSVCTTWGVGKIGYYLLDCWAGKLEFPELKRQAVALAAKWTPEVILIEDAASGQSLIQELQRESRLTIKPFKPDRDKIARAHAVSPVIEAGRVFLPEDAEWLADYLEELSLFPNAAHDDRVDSTTSALDYLIHLPDTGILDYYSQMADAQRTA